MNARAQQDNGSSVVRSKAGCKQTGPNHEGDRDKNDSGEPITRKGKKKDPCQMTSHRARTR